MKSLVKILFWISLSALIVSVAMIFLLISDKGGNGVINFSDYTSAFLGPIFSWIAGISLILIIILTVLKRKIK